MLLYCFSVDLFVAFQAGKNHESRTNKLNQPFYQTQVQSFSTLKALSVRLTNSLLLSGKLTKPNFKFNTQANILLNHTYQTKPTKQNLPNQTKPTKPNQTKHTKPTCAMTSSHFCENTQPWVCCAFGNVFISIINWELEVIFCSNLPKSQEEKKSV